MKFLKFLIIGGSFSLFFILMNPFIMADIAWANCFTAINALASIWYASKIVKAIQTKKSKKYDESGSYSSTSSPTSNAGSENYSSPSIYSGTAYYQRAYHRELRKLGASDSIIRQPTISYGGTERITGSYRTRCPGRILEVCADPGTYVASGDVIAVIQDGWRGTIAIVADSEGFVNDCVRAGNSFPSDSYVNFYH
jgi:hypothetical protein